MERGVCLSLAILKGDSLFYPTSLKVWKQSWGAEGEYVKVLEADMSFEIPHARTWFIWMHEKQPFRIICKDNYKKISIHWKIGGTIRSPLSQLLHAKSF